MRKIFFFNLLVCLVTLASCKEKNKSIYEGCCGAEATVDTFHLPTHDVNGNLIDSIHEAKVYIPNIFITDYSGENNLFFIFGNPAVKNISSFIIKDADGAILFHRENFQPNDSGSAWDGLKPDGNIYQGSFDYVAVIEFIDGQSKTYVGKSCAYNCIEGGFPSENLPNCLFPSQHDGNGGVDSSLLFNDCF